MIPNNSSSNEVSRLDLHSTWGMIRLKAVQGKVVSCSLPRLRAEPRESFMWRKTNLVAADSENAHVLKESEQFLRKTFAGKKSKTPKFQWPEATPFTTRVWKALLEIPHGETMGYGELAKSIGRPGGARAVGRACGANPLPLFIPCHRVLPKDGSLGGFSSGLPWKRLLLEKEGCL